ncbi:MAG: carboxylating nicotinate-nucleotide diphosphorylase [Candidatus Cloacimonetes bacterium]|nr:carboxylating nicotinate-nucleotide diphosphorylase [Candidatus Cloacimonadota bacterium]
MSIEQIIKLSLEEDIFTGDISTEFLKLDMKQSKAEFIAKADGIIAGLHVAELTFKTVDTNIVFTPHVNDGMFVTKGTLLASIEGCSASLLKAERVALNFLQRLSGIASLTHLYVKELAGTEAKLLDTRKTTPLLRQLQKYAVRVGGGYNHRFGLYDMVMLKENHIRAAGSITEAVSRVKASNTSYKIEVEVTNHEELIEAVNCKVDRVMLDNMSLEEIRKAVIEFGEAVELEASGNVTLETIREIALTGVHYISSGTLTHSYKSLDISMLFKN